MNVFGFQKSSQSVSVSRIVPRIVLTDLGTTLAPQPIRHMQLRSSSSIDGGAQLFELSEPAV